MFPKFHMTGDTKAARYGIIATKTLLKDYGNENPWFEFISFMGRKRDKTNTTEYSKRGIVWDFVIK